MAATVSIFHPKPSEWLVTIVETNMSHGETTEIQGENEQKLPKIGRVMRVRSELVSGSAVNINPTLSTSSNFYKIGTVIECEPDVYIDEQPNYGARYAMEGDILYHRSNPNTGSNNSIRTSYLIVDGWE